jgi:hypothetical protein
MAKSVWEKAGDEARQAAEQADTKADSLLDKLKASKWTAAIIVGGAAICLLIWGVSILLAR